MKVNESSSKIIYPSKRIDWIDISKGVLIALTVLGHSIPGPHYDLDASALNYIYLFNMPAFFIISGVLYNQSKYKSTKELVIKRSRRLLVPYITYLIIINGTGILFKFLTGEIAGLLILKEVAKSIYGGKYLGHNAGVLWFITCLFFVELLFYILDKNIKHKNNKILILISLYFIAHIQSWYFKAISLPLAIDIVLIAIVYYSFGVYFKEKLFNTKYILISFILVIAFIFIRINNIKFLGIDNYGLELMGHHNTYLILDFVIPISFSIIVFNMCKFISKVDKFKILNELGQYTLPIMCLHIIISENINKILGTQSIVLFTFMGILIPYLISKLGIDRNRKIKKILM